MARHIEDVHQEALITWSKVMRVTLPNGEVVPLKDVLYAIPNGGKRNAKEAARFKRQGVTAGVSDLHLIRPANGYHGLWIEMKKPVVRGQSKPSVQPSQLEWLDTAQKCDHKGIVAFGIDEAKTAIREYLGSLLVDPRNAI